MLYPMQPEHAQHMYITVRTGLLCPFALEIFWNESKDEKNASFAGMLQMHNAKMGKTRKPDTIEA